MATGPRTADRGPWLPARGPRASVRRAIEHGTRAKGRGPLARADRERADREQADREQADREQADREQADREQADREQADREQERAAA